MNCVAERRLGRLQISLALLKSIDNDNLLALYHKLGIILRIEEHFIYNLIEIWFAHPKLPKIEEGMAVPFYNATIEKDNAWITIEQSNDQQSRIEIEDCVGVI